MTNCLLVSQFGCLPYPLIIYTHPPVAHNTHKCVYIFERFLICFFSQMFEIIKVRSVGRSVDSRLLVRLLAHSRLPVGSSIRFVWLFFCLFFHSLSSIRYTRHNRQGKATPSNKYRSFLMHTQQPNYSCTCVYNQCTISVSFLLLAFSPTTLHHLRFAYRTTIMVPIIIININIRGVCI